MKASLTVGQPDTATKTGPSAAARTAVKELVAPTRGAATRSTRVPARTAPTSAPATQVPPAVLLSANDRLRQRLKIVAPRLFERPRPQAEAKLLEILTKRIGALITDAITRVRARFGAAAGSLAPGERACLQDALLLSRMAAEDILPEVVDCFTPGELFALLATGCLVHAPEQLDALRCHEIVCGDHSLLAREAVLDLLAQGPDEASIGRLDKLVERRISARVATISPDAGALLERITDSPSHGGEGQFGRRSRQEVAMSGSERLTTALRRGNDDAAIDMIARQAGVSRATVQAAIFLRNAKGLVSLAWQGGFDAHAAVTIQSTLGHLGPDELIHPTVKGEFALDKAEMLWQCRFLASILPDTHVGESRNEASAA